jgi:hypothetical protein
VGNNAANASDPNGLEERVLRGQLLPGLAGAGNGGDGGQGVGTIDTAPKSSSSFGWFDVVSVVYRASWYANPLTAPIVFAYDVGKAYWGYRKAGLDRGTSVIAGLTTQLPIVRSIYAGLELYDGRSLQAEDLGRSLTTIDQVVRGVQIGLDLASIFMAAARGAGVRLPGGRPPSPPGMMRNKAGEWIPVPVPKPTKVPAWAPPFSPNIVASAEPEGTPEAPVPRPTQDQIDSLPENLRGLEWELDAKGRMITRTEDGLTVRANIDGAHGDIPAHTDLQGLPGGKIRVDNQGRVVPQSGGKNAGEDQVEALKQFLGVDATGINRVIIEATKRRGGKRPRE